MKSRCDHWWVYTPEYGVVVPILDDGTGPMEYQSDVVCVDAENKRQAIIRGIAKLRAENSKWLADSDGNPFTGIQATPARCSHGLLACDCAGEVVCEQCEAEAEAVDEVARASLGDEPEGAA